MPRRPALLAVAAAALLALPASADARLPFVAATPAAGDRTTTFRVDVGRAIAQRMEDGSDVSAFYAHDRRRCVKRVLPTARVWRDGRVRVVLDPAALELPRGRWCTGTYRVRVIAQLAVDDDDETGAGGVFDTPLARSRFVVR